MVESNRLAISATVHRVDNGYVVYSEDRGNLGHYCKTLSVVVSELYHLFEGTRRLTREKLEEIKNVAGMSPEEAQSLRTENNVEQEKPN